MLRKNKAKQLKERLVFFGHIFFILYTIKNNTKVQKYGIIKY